MKSTSIAWALVRATFFAFVGWLAVALLFGGISEVGARVFESSYAGRWVTLREASRFWTSQWFMIFGMISPLLWLGLFVFFAWRFVRPGYRLMAAGCISALAGLVAMIGPVAHIAGANTGLTSTELVVNAVIAVTLIAVGVWLFLRRPHEA